MQQVRYEPKATNPQVIETKGPSKDIFDCQETEGYRDAEKEFKESLREKRELLEKEKQASIEIDNLTISNFK